jgi:alpha/beta superfamily hydrolase
LTDVSALGEPVTFPSGGLTLEGLFHRPQAVPYPAAVVCHPHPLYGGDMHNSVVAAVCQALVEADIAALRFNFRGVGRSLGRFGDGVGERADAIAALAHLRQTESVDPAKVGIVGYSFGAAVALVAADEQVAAVAAISTPAFGRGIPELTIRCPTLLVSGDRDDVAPPGQLTALAEMIGPRCQVALVRGADHFWWGHEDKVAQAVARFFRDCLRMSGQ